MSKKNNDNESKSRNDSVPLEQLRSNMPRIQVANIKLILLIFIMFIVVVSDVFTNNIISGFGSSAVCGRMPTSWGVVLQGIFLVLFYIIAVYLTEHNIL